jgi:hypothetical protein
MPPFTYIAEYSNKNDEAYRKVILKKCSERTARNAVGLVCDAQDVQSTYVLVRMVKARVGRREFRRIVLAILVMPAMARIFRTVVRRGARFTASRGSHGTCGTRSQNWWTMP